jgi:hypothetical protein
MPYYLEPPPLPLPIYHHFLKTRFLLWASPELSRALVQVTAALASPRPSGDLLACIATDLKNYYEDLELLEGEGEAQAWGPLGIQTFPTRHVLGQALEQLKGVAGDGRMPEPQADFSMSPVKAWFDCWVDPETARAVHCLGHAALVFQLETNDEASWVGDSLATVVMGLVCDLPLLANQMEAAGSSSARCSEP